MHTSKCLDVFLSVGVWSTCELVKRCVCVVVGGPSGLSHILSKTITLTSLKRPISLVIFPL